MYMYSIQMRDLMIKLPGKIIAAGEYVNVKKNTVITARQRYYVL